MYYTFSYSRNETHSSSTSWNWVVSETCCCGFHYGSIQRTQTDEPQFRRTQADKPKLGRTKSGQTQTGEPKWPNKCAPPPLGGTIYSRCKKSASERQQTRKIYSLPCARCLSALLDPSVCVHQMVRVRLLLYLYPCARGPCYPTWGSGVARIRCITLFSHPSRMAACAPRLKIADHWPPERRQVSRGSTRVQQLGREREMRVWSHPDARN